VKPSKSVPLKNAKKSEAKPYNFFDQPSFFNKDGSIKQKPPRKFQMFSTRDTVKNQPGKSVSLNDSDEEDLYEGGVECVLDTGCN
jgi:hypothetical protein